MCGIVGIMDSNREPVDLSEVRDMTMAIAHRGPDEDGFYMGAFVGMGMRRLSIIDLKTGRQPISNEDGTIWVVFNGEIYNYRELRQELQAKGHVFATTTDTEVIVHLYEEFGERCVEKMRGMFGFSLWDDRKQTLLLARDRLGIKPLYYAEVGGRLLFASELKAILQIPGVERGLNWGSVSNLFTFLSSPADESIVAGVHKLEPGHILVASPGRRLRIEPYWDVEFRPDRARSEAETVEQLRELMRETVEIHMVSDVPVGAFLSGGLDSSAIVAHMARLAPRRLRTFSIGFSDADFNELRFARMTAETLGTEHHELMLEPDGMDILEDLTWYLDEPFGDSSAIPTYMVSKLASEFGKVVLSGDGGDELFAGYDKYAVEGRERNYDRLPGPLRRLLGSVAEKLPDGMKGRNFLRHLSFTGPERCLHASTLFGRAEKKMLFQDSAFELLSDYDPWAPRIKQLSRTDGNWLSAMQYADIKGYLPLDILTKVDRMSMAHSLEARVPLLDHKLVEFAATIPPEMTLKSGTRKYIFKRAMRGVLPDAIIDRPKHGFAVPLDRWFRGRLDNLLQDLLLSETTRQRGIFRPAYVEHLLDLHKKGRNLDLQLWTLISFEMWCRVFLDRKVGKKQSKPEAAVSVSAA